MSELLPCPFCGMVAATIWNPGDGHWVVECYDGDGGCGVEISRATEAEAIAAWNNRPTPIAEGDVERVARAITEEIGWGTFSHFDPNDVRRVARAAISAMRAYASPYTNCPPPPPACPHCGASPHEGLCAYDPMGSETQSGEK